MARCAHSTIGLDSADMEPRWPPLQESSAHKAWQEVLRPIAAEMQTCAPQLAGRIVDRYQSELPKIVPDASAVAEQLASVEASLRQIAQCIETGDDPRRDDLAPATAAIARSGVQRNIPLNDRIRSVRLAHEETWRWLFDQITGTVPAAGHAKALELATNWLFAYTDNVPVRAEHIRTTRSSGRKITRHPSSATPATAPTMASPGVT